jgi:hypothetical protein
MVGAISKLGGWAPAGADLEMEVRRILRLNVGMVQLVDGVGAQIDYQITPEVSFGADSRSRAVSSSRTQLHHADDRSTESDGRRRHGQETRSRFSRRFVGSRRQSRSI